MIFHSFVNIYQREPTIWCLLDMFCADDFSVAALLRGLTFWATTMAPKSMRCGYKSHQSPIQIPVNLSKIQVNLSKIQVNLSLIQVNPSKIPVKSSIVIWWWFSNPVKSPYFLAVSRCSDVFPLVLGVSEKVPFNSRSPRRCNADAVAGWISIWSPVIWTHVDRRWDSRKMLMGMFMGILHRKNWWFSWD